MRINRDKSKFLIILLSLLFLASCQSSEKWTPPKFVKEWEIKEVKPEFSTPQIISITANKKGVFVLVKAIEVRYPTHEKQKRAAEMTKKEKERFFIYNIEGRVFSGSAVYNMTEEEQDKVIDFVIKHFMPPKKINKMTEKEKDEIIDFLIYYGEKGDENKGRNKKWIEREGKDNVISLISEKINKATKEDVEHYRIQQYDFEGNFIKQWPEGNKLILTEDLRKNTKKIIVTISQRLKPTFKEIDSREYLIKPLIMGSDEFNNIYLADYYGNKIVRFDEEGNLVNAWKIKQEASLGNFYEMLGFQKGLSITRDRLYVVCEGFSGKIGIAPQISEYDLKGNLIREKVIKPPRVPGRMPITGIKIPLVKEDGKVVDLAADKAGNLYLFAPDTRILVLDNQWREKGYIKTVLKEGFDRPKPVYDPDRKREIKYEEEIYKISGVGFFFFRSDKLSWIENTSGLYYADKTHLSPQEELYVSFIGNKPFGVIDAMVFNKKGNMLGYWKHEKKSYSDWFAKLTYLQQLETMDLALDISFYEDNIFIGRTLQEGTGARNNHTVIQKFVKEGMELK